MQKLKILHTVESYWPAVNGMAEVVRQISEKIALEGHDVTVAAGTSAGARRETHNLVKIVRFNISGNDVGGYRWGEVRDYQEYILSGDFDIVVNFAAQQWATDLCFPILNKIKAKKVFVPTGFSALYNEHYSKYFEQMPTHFEAYDANVFLSSDYRDIHFARSHNIKNCYLIPNGADQKEFAQKPPEDIRKLLNIPAKNKLLLLVGSHTGAKGHKQAIDIFTKAKIKNATLLIVGQSPGGGCGKTCRKKAKILRFFPFLTFNGGRKQIILGALQALLSGEILFAYFRSKRILNVDLTREQTVAAFFGSDLFFFPSNVECSPIVVFEAAAAGLPFLTTDVGNCGELIQWLGSGKLLPTIRAGDMVHAAIESSANMLEEVFRTEDFLKTGTVGRRQWESNYTWDSIAKKYIHLYTSLVANRPPSELTKLT